MTSSDMLSSAGIVSLSIMFYSFIFRATRSPKVGSSATTAAAHLRAISASHSVLITMLSAIALRQQHWRLQEDQAPSSSTDGNLDDTANPMIQGRSRLANAVTSWEAGYLLYDTCAMLYTPPKAARTRPSPVMLTHHALIAAGLLYLQLYIARGRERGVRVVLGLLLMNASNPLLHARWWARKKGQDSKTLDAAFLATFAAVRFGGVAWILQQYGAYHRLGVLGVAGRLRVPCQAGTAMIVGLNGVWWVWMCRNFVRRISRDSRLKRV